MLQVDKLRDLMVDAPSEAQALASTIKDNLRTLVDDVRRVTHGLRPPALDDLGLGGALREQIYLLTANAGLDVELNLPASDDSMPAAAEVAIYRIASEAVTNIVRHASAGRCRLTLVVGDCITLEVADDGVGMVDGATLGLGLVSMRHRAVELGGECTITATGAGTRVLASIPVAG